ncbi:MAG: hypothetical protein ABJC04_11220, partial [Verrucomicrobiota bacterium]
HFLHTPPDPESESHKKGQMVGAILATTIIFSLVVAYFVVGWRNVRMRRTSSERIEEDKFRE